MLSLRFSRRNSIPSSACKPRRSPTSVQCPLETVRQIRGHPDPPFRRMYHPSETSDSSGSAFTQICRSAGCTIHLKPLHHRIRIHPRPPFRSEYSGGTFFRRNPASPWHTATAISGITVKRIAATMPFPGKMRTTVLLTARTTTK